MGAGQIGGIATLLDLDFNNAAGFVGKTATIKGGEFVVYYFSHAMLFCAGALIESHIVLTPAICVIGEDYKFSVFAGTHKFLENAGATRVVENICFHRAFNATSRHFTDNIAILVLSKQFGFRYREPNTDFIINRIRYGIGTDDLKEREEEFKCIVYGWGSRRNGFLLPLLIELRKMEVNVVNKKRCDEIWNPENKFICLTRPRCTNEKYGALCPDDMGSVVACQGYVVGMMTSRLVDRPCGVGFLNLDLYRKFLECAVDDSRDVMESNLLVQSPARPEVKHVHINADDIPTPTKTTEDCAPSITHKSTTPNKYEVYKQVMGMLDD